MGDKGQGVIRWEPNGEWVELINGVWMGQGSLSWMCMGCSQAPASSRGVRKGSLSLLECFCVSVCFLPELYVWPSTHVCITPSCLIGPALGSGPGPWHLACWAHRLIFLQTLSKPRSPSFTALWAARRPPERAGDPQPCASLYGPLAFLSSEMGCPLPMPHLWPVTPTKQFSVSQ